MTELAFDRDSMNKLLDIARAEMRVLQIDLMDIEHAHAAAQSAMDSANGQVTGGHGDDGGCMYGEEATQTRQRNLHRSVMALSQAEDSARARLKIVADEITKLTHLVDAAAPSSTSGNAHSLTARDVFQPGTLAG